MNTVVKAVRSRGRRESMTMGTGKRSKTFLEAARTVLEEMKVPMHFKKITELAIQKRYLRSEGRTPEWTMGARLSVDVKEKGPRSEFNRVGSGRYGLRKWKRGTGVRAPVDASEGDAGGRRYWLVSVERENFDADERAGSLDTIGVRHRMRKTLATLQPGDRVVIYIKKVAAFGAIMEVTGPAYSDHSHRWPVGSAQLSSRIPCEPTLLLAEQRKLDARPLYARLEVFTQYPAKHRTLALRNGITEIGSGDYREIERAISESRA